MDWRGGIETIVGLYKYSPLFKDPSGPIAGISVKRLSSGFEAAAKLNPYYLPAVDIRRYQLYDNLIGHGFADTKWKAILKSISEALERWAYFSSLKADLEIQRTYGLITNPSTSGFAAFPGSADRSREQSLVEAKERWDLVNWWLKRLRIESAGSSNGVETLRIDSALEGHTLILRAQGESGFAFGVGAGSEYQPAYEAALKELERNRIALDRYRHLEEKRPAKMDILEQRLLFFSSQTGNELFESRVRETSSLRSSGEKPSLICDMEIVGPWSKFTKVWRCLYDGTVENTKDPQWFIF